MARKGTLPFRMLWWLLKRWRALVLIGGSLYLGFASGRCVYEKPFRPSPHLSRVRQLRWKTKAPTPRRTRHLRSFTSSPKSLRFFSRTLRRLRVRTFRVQRRPVQKWLRLQGVVQWSPQSRSLVRAPVTGVLDQWFVQQAGLQVQKDERLFSVRPPELLQLQQRWLSHLQKISTPPTPEWTAQSVTLRKALLKNGLSMAQLDSLKKYKRPFRRLFVKVPLRSHVLKRFVKTGQSLKQGQPVVQLADLSVLDVSFSVPIRWWSAIRLGQKVNWTTSALPGQRFEATIAGFGVTVREVVTVRGRLSNPELRLRPGLRLQGVLKLSVNGDGRASKTGVVLKPHEQPMVVPTSAVLWQGKQAYVFVRQVHKVRRTVRYLRRKLEVGGRFQQWVLVLKGLSVGDEVVSRGAGFLDAELSLQQSQLWGQP